jgi:hypothetical protein
MKSPRAIALSVLLIALTTAAQAAKVDMRDPRRAVGREDDVRVDAELARDAVTSHSTLGVTYQIQNLTESPIAFADKTSEASYDSETETITVAFGAEVPDGASMPHLVIIGPGEKKTFRGSGTVSIMSANVRTPWLAIPRFVQIKVTVLRDVKPFTALIDQQNKSAAAPPMDNQSFDRWVNAVGTVFLNLIPVRWEGKGRGSDIDAERSAPGGSF